MEWWPIPFSIDMLINSNLNVSSPSSSSPEEEVWYVAAIPLALLIFASLVYSKKNNITQSATDDDDDDDDDISWKSATDDEEEIIDEMMLLLEADAKYAQQLQLEEALQRPNTSMLTCKEVCEICLEQQDSWQMFRNSLCSHSFCYPCTTKHATTKMQERNKTIPCPGLNCASTLDFDTLRLIIPTETLIKWDQFLCESSILESHKLYCPFTDCSVLLINDDTSNSITKIECPVCQRSFCAVCRVPWHSEFSCKEYGKLKGGKEHEMTVALANKKKWMKCPNCNFFVEKAEGCVHITCRCKYEFCYDCGAKWSCNHGGCRTRGN